MWSSSPLLTASEANSSRRLRSSGATAKSVISGRIAPDSSFADVEQAVQELGHRLHRTLLLCERLGDVAVAAIRRSVPFNNEMVWTGCRRSWLAMARNRLFARLARSASRRAAISSASIWRRSLTSRTTATTSLCTPRVHRAQADLDRELAAILTTGCSSSRAPNGAGADRVRSIRGGRRARPLKRSGSSCSMLCPTISSLR